MKRVFIIGAIILGAILIAAPFAVRMLGPRLIVVSPPSGTPIGEVDFPRPEISLIAVKAILPLEAMRKKVEEEAPKRLEGREQKNIHKRIKNGAYSWAIERGGIQLQKAGNSLIFATPFTGAAQAQGNLDAKILTIPISGTAQLAGTLGGSLAPTFTTDWKIQPNVTPAVNLTQAELDIAGLAQIDIRDLLQGAVSPLLQKEMDKLGPALKEGIDLRSDVDKLWGELHLSEQISDEPQVWLTVQPGEVLMSPLDYSLPDSISVTAGIRSLSTVTNTPPQEIPVTPLPALTLVEKPPVTQLRVPLIVSIAHLNEVLRSETFTTETSFGTKLEFTGVEATVGQEGFVNFSVALTAGGSFVQRGVQGTLWLKGKPIVDYEEQTLAFADVDFTVETKDKLTVAAAWLLEEVIIKGIQQELRVDLDDYKEELYEEVGKALGSATFPNDLKLSVDNLDIRLADVYTITRQHPDSEPDPGVVIVISATGSATTRLTSF